MSITITPANFTSWHLSNMADVASPDRSDGIGTTDTAPTGDGSPGAVFLRHVATDLAERVAWATEHDDFDPDEFGDLAGSVADDAVPTYTAERWQVFTDLAAWQEVGSNTVVGRYGDRREEAEVDGLPLSGDMSDMAGQVLYAIALRLVNALVADAVETADELGEVES